MASCDYQMVISHQASRSGGYACQASWRLGLDGSESAPFHAERHDADDFAGVPLFDDSSALAKRSFPTREDGSTVVP